METWEVEESLEEKGEKGGSGGGRQKGNDWRETARASDCMLDRGSYLYFSLFSCWAATIFLASSAARETPLWLSRMAAGGVEEKYSEFFWRVIREGGPKSQSSLRALSVSSYRSLPSPCLPPRSAGAPLRARDRLSLLPSSPSRTKPATQRQNSMAVV